MVPVYVSLVSAANRCISNNITLGTVCDDNTHGVPRFLVGLYATVDTASTKTLPSFGYATFTFVESEYDARKVMETLPPAVSLGPNITYGVTTSEDLVFAFQPLGNDPAVVMIEAVVLGHDITE